MDEHTSGPWRIFKDGGDDIEIYSEFGFVASVHPCADSQEANTILISCAPQLLDALKFANDGLLDAMQNLDNFSECYALVKKRFVATRHIINHAEGNE